MTQVNVTLPASIAATIGHRIGESGNKTTVALTKSLILDSLPDQDSLNGLVLNLIQEGLKSALRTLKPEGKEWSEQDAIGWVNKLSQESIRDSVMATSRPGRKASDYPASDRKADASIIKAWADKKYETKLSPKFASFVSESGALAFGSVNLAKQIEFLYKTMELIDHDLQKSNDAEKEETLEAVLVAHQNFAQWLQKAKSTLDAGAVSDWE